MSLERSLPTPKQCEQFAEHICWAHSWYKHIPLLDGAEFVFFFSEDAGNGFTEKNPRLHYSWKTTQEYRCRFGYLDYAYRLPGMETFARDGKTSPVAISPELLDLSGVILYPFVSDDFNAPETLASLIAESPKDLRQATAHPQQQEVIQWYEAWQIRDRQWDRLSDSHREMAIAASNPWQERLTDENAIAAELAKLPLLVAEYLSLENKALNLYYALQAGELKKVREAIARLEWAVGSG